MIVLLLVTTFNLFVIFSEVWQTSDVRSILLCIIRILACDNYSSDGNIVLVDNLTQLAECSCYLYRWMKSHTSMQIYLLTVICISVGIWKMVLLQ